MAEIYGKRCHNIIHICSINDFNQSREDVKLAHTADTKTALPAYKATIHKISSTNDINSDTFNYTNQKV